MANSKLTEDQKNKVIARSREARAFLASDLYKALDEWVELEKRLVGTAIVLNRRAKHEESLTRQEFIDQKCGYYLGISQFTGIIKAYAGQEEQIINQKEIEDDGQRSEQY